MRRAVVASIGAATAYAAFATESDAKAVYEKFVMDMNVTLTSEESAFHFANFVKYATETNSIKGSLVDAFLESMPAVTAARASEIAAEATFAIDTKFFSNRTVRDVKKLMGVNKPITPLQSDNSSSNASDALPIAYSNEKSHPECSMIGFARDQGNCGSCWAMAAVAAFNDRYCIASQGEMTKLLSTQYMTSCSTAGSCEGGWPDSAWEWIAEHGVPTGGEHEDVDSGETCYPYHFHKCAHHMETDLLPACNVSDVAPDGQRTPKCSKTCTSKLYPKDISEDRFFAKRPTNYYTTDDVKRDLMESGPVSACYNVYEDFLLYAGGVYKPGPRRGRVLGGHAVKVIGWGVDEKGEEYWEAVNSWNELWGENGGKFRVALKANIFGEFAGGFALLPEEKEEGDESDSISSSENEVVRM